jgi:hypothetical protein
MLIMLITLQAVFDAFEGDDYVKTEVEIEVDGQAQDKQQAWVYVW